MNRIVLLFIMLCFSACNYFENKKLDTQVLLEEELQTFDWHTVDDLPTFSICEDSTTSAKDNCFQNTLLSLVNTYLQSQTIVVSEDLDDTIRLKIRIDSKGILTIDSILSKAETKFQIPEIDSLLIQSLKNLPEILPAIKRGQHVTTAFELPVVLKIH